jgi:hypothetical protein
MAAPAVRVGNKFANLSRAAEVVNVPAALCITVDVFRAALGPERMAFLDQFFADLRATVGCFLLSSMPALDEVLADLTLPPELRAELHDQLLMTFGSLEESSFAIRSSGAMEDSNAMSFAGIYTSTLCVQGFDELCAAIITCWQSYYSYPAVAARVRANQYTPEPTMAVIVQAMVPAVLAGVAFTTSAADDDIFVEYVHGLGDGLVSGVVVPKSYRIGDQVERPTEEAHALAEVSKTVARMRKLFGQDVDVEWAWDSQAVQIVQVRPVTARIGTAKISREPFFLTAALYIDVNLPPDMDLGECREVYVTYVSKRAAAYRRAAAQGVATGAAHIVAFNGPGLLAHRAAFAQLLTASPIRQVVLDINTNIRQVILDKTEVFDYLVSTFRVTPTLHERHTIIIRDFVQGKYGFISRLMDDRGVFVECSKEGLLNINRGIAHCDRISVRDGEQPLSGSNVVCEGGPELFTDFADALPQILSFTRLMNQEQPGTQLEWVLEAGVPYFVDFSREQASLTRSEQVGTVAISQGVARGAVLHLVADEMLYRLSIGPAVSVDKFSDVLDHDGLQSLVNLVASAPHKPILFSKRPYAVLSVFFEHVAGFVFAEGAVLCHLAILLREARLPAVICSNLRAEDGDEALITDGHLDIFRKEPQV